MSRTGRLSKANIVGMISITMIVMALLITMFILSNNLRIQNQKYESRKTELEQMLKDEELRAGEIESLKEYIDSEEYIEQIARDKLGLVYSDEILFIAED